MPNAPAATNLPDIFTPLQLLLTLLSVANRALLSRPDDPLPQALSRLTDFGKKDINRIASVTDSAGLYELLRDDPEMFTDYLLLGRLTFASPLRDSLAAYLVKDHSGPAGQVATQRAELLAYVGHHAAVQNQIFEDYLPTRYDEEDRADAVQERADFRAAVERAFAAWQHTLGALVLPAPAPVLPPTEDGRQRSIQPQEDELSMLRLAVANLLLLPGIGPPRFADALQRLPDYHPQRLEELQAYVKNAEPDEQLPLSRQQCLLLYIAAHTALLALLNDLLDGQGLDDLLLSRQEQEGFPPGAVSNMREHVTATLTGFIALIRKSEGDTDDFQALEARLAPVLALGAE